MLESSDKTGSI